MKNRIIRILLIVIIVLNNIYICTYAKETPDELKNLYARSAVLIDADSGRVLFGKNETDILPMASTTKIMTCILALENMKDNQICAVSENAVRQPKVHLGMYEGEKFHLKDLLYSLMLESHNDSAVVIAEAIGGSVENFADMMNEKAAEIGCKDTYFITPNGLDAKDETGIHSTTAKDLSLIMRYCISESPKRKEFLEITRKASYQFSDISGKRTYSCNNHNAFLGMMDGALSGKTGFTNDAGYCYVGALKRGERTFIVALLACGWPNNKGYKWKDTRKLMEYALDNYEYKSIGKSIDKRNVTPPVFVSGGYDKMIPFNNEIYVQTEIKNNDSEHKVLLHHNEKITMKIVCENTVNAPVKKGVQVGNVFYMLNNSIIKTDSIVTKAAVFERSPRICFEILLDRMLLKDLTR